MKSLARAHGTLSCATLLLACGVLLSGCRGEELARVALTAPGQTAAATWTTKGATRASVWVDYEGSWIGHEDDPDLSYAIEILEGTTTSVQTLSCSTSSCSTHVCGSSVSIGNRQSTDCECKTSCTVELPRAATFTVRATVTNPRGNFTGTNASLVFRQ